jgi:CheY-like chemotaxis protein
MSVESVPGQGTRIVLRTPLGNARTEILEQGVQLADGSELVVDEEHMATLYDRDAPRRIRLLIVDEQRLFRDGLAAMLSDVDGFEVVGQAPNGRMALQLATSLQPEVVLMGVDLPVIDAIEVTRRLRTQTPQVNVILLGRHVDAEARRIAEEAGAAALLTEDERPKALIAVVRQVVGAHTS